MPSSLQQHWQTLERISSVAQRRQLHQQLLQRLHCCVAAPAATVHWRHCCAALPASNTVDVVVIMSMYCIIWINKSQKKCMKARLTNIIPFPSNSSLVVVPFHTGIVWQERAPPVIPTMIVTNTSENLNNIECCIMILLSLRKKDRCYIHIPIVGLAAFIGKSMAIGEPCNASNHRQPLDLVLLRIVRLSRLIIHLVTAALLSKKVETTYKFLHLTEGDRQKESRFVDGKKRGKIFCQ